MAAADPDQLSHTLFLGWYRRMLQPAPDAVIPPAEAQALPTSFGKVLPSGSTAGASARDEGTCCTRRIREPVVHEAGPGRSSPFKRKFSRVSLESADFPGTIQQYGSDVSYWLNGFVSLHEAIEHSFPFQPNFSRFNAGTL